MGKIRKLIDGKNSIVKEITTLYHYIIHFLKSTWNAFCDDPLEVWTLGCIPVFIIYNILYFTISKDIAVTFMLLYMTGPLVLVAIFVIIWLIVDVTTRLVKSYKEFKGRENQ